MQLKSRADINFIHNAGETSCSPIVYTNMENQKSVLVFDDEFCKEAITKLINDIESIRQIGGYSEIDLYFSSVGGYADYLFILSDYLNNVEDIHINFIANGIMSSCGFYILLLIDNSNIDILFNQTAYGLIHLADIFISSRGQLSKDSSRYNFDKFTNDNLKVLNEFLKKELDKLDISKQDREKLEQGQDVYLFRDELEKVIIQYHQTKYYESEGFISGMIEMKNNIEMLQDKYKEIKKQYKSCMKKDLEDVLKDGD